MSSRKSNQRFMAWSLVAIILLLGTNAYQYWQNMQLDKKLELHEQELAAVESTQGQLEKDYELALTSLEDLKGNNSELNAIIDKQKEDLKEQKDKISNLIWKTRKLDQAKEEIKKLNDQALEYVAEVTNLKAEKESLLAENSELKESTFHLQSSLEVISEEKDSINKEKDSILLVKEELKKQNISLNIKATRASVIEVQELDVEGFSIRENGKLNKKRRAKNIQLLKFCFKPVPNDLSDLETEMFYMRIISPSGETMYKKQLGGGVFKKALDNTDTRFTFSPNFNMPMTDEIVCVNYEPKETLSSGLYLVEIYNKGYLSGKGSFSLK